LCDSLHRHQELLVAVNLTNVDPHTRILARGAKRGRDTRDSCDSLVKGVIEF
jgi:hypothetical protein